MLHDVMTHPSQPDRLPVNRSKYRRNDAFTQSVVNTYLKSVNQHNLVQIFRFVQSRSGSRQCSHRMCLSVLHYLNLGTDYDSPQHFLPGNVVLLKPSKAFHGNAKPLANLYAHGSQSVDQRTPQTCQETNNLTLPHFPPRVSVNPVCERGSCFRQLTALLILLNNRV